MIFFMPLIALCNNCNDNRICIENIREVLQKEKKLDDFVCCAMMSILNHRYNIYRTSITFIKFCSQSYSSNVIPPYCHVLINISLHRYFGPQFTCATLLTSATMNKIDAIINIQILKIYESHIIANKCYECMLILMQVFVQSFFNDNDQRLSFLKEFLKRSKSLYNQDIDSLMHNDINCISTNKCLHFTETYIAHGSGYVSECANCMQNKIYHREFYDFDLIFTMLNALSVNSKSEAMKKKTQHNTSKHTLRNVNLPEDYELQEKKNTKDITLLINFTQYEIYFLNTIITMNLHKTSDLEQNYRDMLQFVDMIAKECYDELKSSVSFLSLTKKSKLLKIQPGTNIEFLELDLFGARDLAYFYLFKDKEYCEDMKKTIVDMILLMRKTFLFMYRDILQLSTSFDFRTKNSNKKELITNAYLHIMTSQHSIF